MNYSLRGKECIAKHQVVVVRQPRALGSRPQRAMHMSMGRLRNGMSPCPRVSSLRLTRILRTTTLVRCWMLAS